jgi:uncharacterized protein
MRCPKCNAELKSSDLGQFGFVVLDVCPDCKGSWFDKGELDRLDQSVWTDVEQLLVRRKEAGEKALSCPKCNRELEPLSPTDEQTLVVDRCTACGGFWLDADELGKIEGVAHRADGKQVTHMRHYKRPPDMSRLKWLVYCFKTFK